MRQTRRKDVSNTFTPSGVVIAHVSLTAQIDDANWHLRDGRLVDAERRSSRTWRLGSLVYRVASLRAV